MTALPYPDPPLMDSAVRLRPWREGDVPALVAGLTDPAVDRFYWARSEPYQREDALWFLSTRDEARSRGESLHFAVVEPETDAVLGGVHLSRVDVEQGRAEIGYWVAANARRRGVATSAVGLLTGWALDALALERLDLTCDLDNLGSQRVAERCGFVRAGERSASEYNGQGRPREQFVYTLSRAGRSAAEGGT